MTIYDQIDGLRKRLADDPAQFLYVDRALLKALIGLVEKGEHRVD